MIPFSRELYEKGYKLITKEGYVPDEILFFKDGQIVYKKGGGVIKVQPNGVCNYNDSYTLILEEPEMYIGFVNEVPSTIVFYSLEEASKCYGINKIYRLVPVEEK